MGSRPGGRVRRLLMRLAVGAAMALLGAGVLAAAAAGAGPSGDPAETRSAPLILGVNADMAVGVGLGGSDGLLGSESVAYVRQPVAWAEIESIPGRYDWSGLDADMAMARGLGVRVLLSLATSPAWARHDPAPDPTWWLCDDPAVTGAGFGNMAPPTDPGDLARFTSALLGRYGAEVWALEAWPEPNLLPNWRATGPDPQDYAVLLEAVIGAVRRTAPQTIVVSGGLAPTTDVGVCYMSDLVFLDRVAATGVLAGVDAVGIEPFGLRSPPGQGPDRGRLNFRRAELLHEVVAKAGLDVPLWAVAWGWHAGGNPDASVWGSHPPQTATRWLGQAFALADARWPWLEAMFVWHLRPPGPATSPAMGFALVGPKGTLTASGREVARLAAGGTSDLPDLEDGAALDPRLAPLALLGALGLAALGLVGARGVPGLRRAARRAVGLGGVIGGRWPVLAVATVLVVWWSAAELATGGSSHWIYASASPAPGTRTLAVALGVLCPVVLALLLANRPDLGPGVALAVAPLSTRLVVLFASRPVGAFEAVALVAAAGGALAWLAGRSREGPPPAAPRWHPLDVVAAGVVVWGALSPWWADFPGPAAREWRTVLLEPALVYALLRLAPEPRRAAARGIDGLVAGGALAAAVGLAGVAMAALGAPATGAVAAEGVLRAVGPYGSPNNLALFVGRAAAAAAATAMWGAGRRRRWHAVAVPLLLGGLAATFSRGALFVATPAAAAVLFWAWRRVGVPRRRLRGAALGLALGALLFVAASAGTQRLRGTLDATPGSTLYIRLRLWQSAAEMGWDNPVLGVGLDNFLYQYRDRYVHRSVVQERFLNHPHNLVLDWWTRLGLPGLAAFGLMAALGLAAAARGLAGRAPALAAGALGIYAYAIAHGMVDNVFFLPDLAAGWWLAQAAALAALGPRAST